MKVLYAVTKTLKGGGDPILCLLTKFSLTHRITPSKDKQLSWMGCNLRFDTYSFSQFTL